MIKKASGPAIQLINFQCFIVPVKISKSEKEGRWQITMDLVDGQVKFRAENNWMFDWGKGLNDPAELIFKGDNIVVKEGRYLITIDMEDRTYDFKKLE